MDPTVLYILLFICAISVCTSSIAAWKPPRRACQMCGRDTPLQRRNCIHCGHLTNR